MLTIPQIAVIGKDQRLTGLSPKAIDQLSEMVRRRNKMHDAVLTVATQKLLGHLRGD